MINVEGRLLRLTAMTFITIETLTDSSHLDVFQLVIGIISVSEAPV